MQTEILAALAAGKQTAIEAYIDARVAVGEPWSIARGLMAAGFSDVGDHPEQVLRNFSSASGFLGRTHKVA